MSNAGRPPSSLALGGSQQGGDAAAGLHSTLESAAASVGDGFEQATEQARATLNGNSAEPREEAPGKQQRRRRQKVADPKPSAGSEAGAISFEQAAQSVAKGIQHISTRSQAAMDRLRDGDSSEEEEEEAVPSLLFWHRSNDSSSSSGNGSRAAAAARESLGEADGLIARARQNANKVPTRTVLLLNLQVCGDTLLQNDNSCLCSRVQYASAISLGLLLARHCRLLYQHQTAPVLKISKAAPC